MCPENRKTFPGGIKEEWKDILRSDWMLLLMLKW